MAAVYILVQKKNPIYKIGKSESPYKRFKQLSEVWGAFDIDKSFVINCKSAEASKLEKALHFLAADYKIHFGVNERNGDTEFFNMKSYNMIKNFCESTLQDFRKNVFIKPFREIYEMGLSYDEYKRIKKYI